MSKKTEIENRLSLNQKIGNPFAFMIDIEDFKQIWIVINFNFYLFVPTPKCNYFVQVQEVNKGELFLIEETTYQDINSLIDYLLSMEVNPNYCRAIH